MTIRFDILTENTRGRLQIDQWLGKLSMLLLACALVMLLLSWLPAALAQEDAPPPAGTVIDPIQEGGEAVLGSDAPALRDRDEAKDEVVGWAAENWGLAADVMGYVFTAVGITVFIAVTLAVGFSIGGIYGWIIGVVLGLIFGFSIGGQWGLVVEGNFVQVPIMVVLAFLGIRGEGIRSYLAIAAATVVYFWIWMDPWLLKTNFWELFNIFRITGADTWADLVGLE